MIERHSRFKDIPNLDKEFNSLIKQIEPFLGSVVDSLPPVEQQKELVNFHVKNSNGDYGNFKKINGEYYIQKKDANDYSIWKLATESDIVNFRT